MIIEILSEQEMGMSGKHADYLFSGGLVVDKQNSDYDLRYKIVKKKMKN